MKRIQKWLAVLGTIAICLCAFPGTIVMGENETASISLEAGGRITAQPGDEVVLSVNVANLPVEGWGAFTLKIYYATEQLDFVDATRGRALNGAFVVCNTDQHPFVLAAMSLQNGTTNGELYCFRFRVKPNIADGEIIQMRLAVEEFVRVGNTAQKVVVIEPQTISKEIVVGQPYLTQMQVKSTPAKMVYVKGDTLDLTGMVLMEMMSNGSTIEVTDVSKVMTSGYDPMKVGKQTVILSYLGKTTTLEVIVFIWGDVDGNEKINMTDALLAARHVAKIVALDDGQRVCANVDGKGEVTMTDALLIARYATKLIASFPVAR